MAYDAKNKYPAPGSAGVSMSVSSDDPKLSHLLSLTESFLNSQTWMNFSNNAEKDFNFREGEQWTEQEKKKLEKRKQAPIVENVIKPIIDRLVGQHRKQYTRIIFRGRNYLPPTPDMPSDEQVIGILSDLAHYVQQRTNYQFEEALMFEDGITCGMGCLWTRMTFDDNIPTITIEYQDVKHIFVDPNSRHYDWNVDAGFVGRWKWVNLDKAKKLYPDKADELEESINGSNFKLANENFNIDRYRNQESKQVRIFEVWYKDYETKRIAVPMDGSPIDMSTLKPRAAKALEKDPSTRIYTDTTQKIKMAVFCIAGILEEKDSPYEHGLFPAVPYFVHRKKDGEPYSFVRMLIDPQTEVNKRRSKALHLLLNNQTIFEKGAITDLDKLKAEKASPEGDIEIKKGYKFEMVKNQELAAAQMQMLQESKQAIREIAGFNIYDRQEIRSNQQLLRKQMSDDLPSVVIFENLRRTRVLQGRLIYGLIKQYFNKEMVFNITDSMQMAQVRQLTMNHLQSIKERTFDVIIEEMPDTTTIQDEQFNMITQFLQAMNMPPPMVQMFLPVMLKMSQLRNKEELIQMLEQMNQPPADLPKISLSMSWDNLTPQEKMAFAAGPMQMPELAQAIQEAPIPPAFMAKEQAGLQKQQIKSQGDVAVAQTGQPDPEAEMAIKGAELEMKREEHSMDMQHEHEKHQMKMMQDARQGDLKQQQAQETHQLKLRQSVIDAETKRAMAGQQPKKDK